MTKRQYVKDVFLLIICICVSIRMSTPGFASEPVGMEETRNIEEQKAETDSLIEESEKEENPIYDNLQKRIQNEWDKGLESIEEVEVIKITGNPVERLLRGITAALWRNLKNIKAGALLIGTSSFCIGVIIAVSARKNKKARRFAVMALITVIPVSLFIITFCLAMMISIFT